VSVAAALVLRAGDESKLSLLARSSTVEAGLAQRARIVLLAAQVCRTRKSVAGWGFAPNGDSVAQPV
jgi:hypothetical protein